MCTIASPYFPNHSTCTLQRSFREWKVSLYLASVFTRPQMSIESSPLPCSLADQGIKIRIRKDIRVRKRPMQVLEPPTPIPLPTSSGAPSLLPASGNSGPAYPSSTGPPVRLEAPPNSNTGGNSRPGSGSDGGGSNNAFAHFPSSTGPPVRLGTPPAPSTTSGGGIPFPSSSARPVRLESRDEHNDRGYEAERERENHRMDRDRDRERERERDFERHRERDDDRISLRRTSGSGSYPSVQSGHRRDASGPGMVTPRCESGDLSRQTKRLRVDDPMETSSIPGGQEVSEPSPISAPSTAQPSSASWAPMDATLSGPATAAAPAPPPSAPADHSPPGSVHYTSATSAPPAYDHRFQGHPPAPAPGPGYQPAYEATHHQSTGTTPTHYPPPPPPHPYSHVPHQPYAYTHPPPAPQPQWHPPPPPPQYDPYMYQHPPPPPPHHHYQQHHVPPPPRRPQGGTSIKRTHHLHHLRTGTTIISNMLLSHRLPQELNSNSQQPLIHLRLHHRIHSTLCNPVIIMLLRLLLRDRLRQEQEVQ